MDMLTPQSTPIPTFGNVFTKPASRSIHMILDFDGTITMEDTTVHITDFACNFPADPDRRGLLLDLWAFCLAEYSSALVNHPYYKAGTQNERRGIDQEIECHRSLKALEEESVTRCGEAGIFYGISGGTFWQAGWKMCHSSQVRIRDGFSEMVGRLENCAGGKSRWGVVSVSWSRDFLRGVLRFALGSAARSQMVPVLSNEINPASGLVIGPSFGPAPYVDRQREQQPTLMNRKRIVASDDKLAAMKSMRDSFQVSVDGRRLYHGEGSLGGCSNLDPLVVYVGDSLTDLECLLEAEVGIVIAMDGKGPLMETLTREKYFVLHISAWTPHREKTLWHAQDFQDIIYSGLFQQLPSAVSKLRDGSA